MLLKNRVAFFCILSLSFSGLALVSAPALYAAELSSSAGSPVAVSLTQGLSGILSSRVNANRMELFQMLQVSTPAFNGDVGASATMSQNDFRASGVYWPSFFQVNKSLGFGLGATYHFQSYWEHFIENDALLDIRLSWNIRSSLTMRAGAAYHFKNAVGIGAVPYSMNNHAMELDVGLVYQPVQSVTLDTGLSTTSLFDFPLNNVIFATIGAEYCFLRNISVGVLCSLCYIDAFLTPNYIVPDEFEGRLYIGAKL